MLSRFKEIIMYRSMIGGLIRRELRGRYKGSLFGFLWNFINPLCQIIVYYLIFSRVFRSGIEMFHVFLVVGIMPWNFFSEALSSGTGCIIEHSDMTKKIYFPREVLPIAAVSSRFVNLLLTFIVVFCVIIASGKGVSSNVIYMPIVLLVEYVLTLGMVLLLSAVNVYFRDIQHIIGVLLMAWVWMTPIMYSFDVLSGFMKSIVSFNPMTPIIIAFQDILYYQVKPDFVSLGKTGAFSIVLFVVGESIFSYLERNFAEEL